jgi:hypothetical protein
MCLREIQEPWLHSILNHKIGEICKSAKQPRPFYISYFCLECHRSFVQLSYYVFFFAIRFTTNYLVTVPNVTLNKKRVYHIRDLSVAMDLHSSQTSTSAVLATRELVSRVLLKVLMNAVNLSVIDFISRFYFSRVMISRRMIVL